MGKSTISTGPFSSSQTVSLPEGNLGTCQRISGYEHETIHQRLPLAMTNDKESILTQHCDTAHQFGLL